MLGLFISLDICGSTLAPCKQYKKRFRETSVTTLITSLELPNKLGQDMNLQHLNSKPGDVTVRAHH